MSVRTFKKLAKKLIKNTKPLTFLVIFTYIIVQPTQFVIYNNKPNTEVVRAAYEQLLLESMNSSNWIINFEALIVWENWDTAINYIVAPWDSLSSIARSFWISVDAIKEANSIVDWNRIRPWQRLRIIHDEWVMVNITKNTTVNEFTRNFQINREEFMNMNHIDDSSTIMEAWRQVFVPLSQIEAERRWLIEKEDFVMLDLSQPDPLIEEILEEYYELNEQQAEEYEAYQQIIITAEQTQEYLEWLIKAEEEARKKAEEAKKAAEEARRKAEEARRKAEEERTLAAQQAAEEARKAAEEARRAAEEEARRAQEREDARQQAQAAQQEEQTQQAVTCWENQCPYNWRCWTKPDNAYCVANDPRNAWLCKDWYNEVRGRCVAQTAPQATARTSTPAPASAWTILEQWYFNPHRVDANVSWRWPWHCTAMAAYLRSQNHGIRIRDYRTWNARDWLRNARNAWFTVNNTPAPWSLMVSWTWYWARWPYWHVMYVESVDRNAGTVVIIDMNYRWRYIATKRVESISNAWWFIHPK